MKKTLLTLTAMFAALQFSHAQWFNGTDIYNTNSGKVGIGIATPLALLQIGYAGSGTLTNTSPQLIVAKPSSIGDNAGTYSYLSEHQQTGTGNSNRLQTTLFRRIAGSNWTGLEYRMQFAVDNSFTDGSKAFIAIGGSDPNTSGGGFISLATAGTDRLSVTNSGNVGIGTTSPSAKLTVHQSDLLGSAAKNATLLSTESGNAGSYNVVQSSKWLVRNSAGSNWWSTRLHDAVSVDGSFLTPQTDTKTWWERDPYNNVQSWGNSADTYMTINAGNVGIGTTTVPSGYKLAVNGAAIATSMKVQLKAYWPDFVFKRDYNLPTLTEVKAYIDKNRHLPDMPSADEVHANGLDLGEMNRLLLKKVEELTLYLMKEHDKNAKQEERLKALETALARKKQMSTLK